ncbi:MAG: GNAT family N-acetyltransferase [Christensenella sp.]|uniref:GNAT family N-acetyltransferase n=1 Tax=Christensenella sp. TaxID=1935934 RepID=UPI002B212AD3|nr:GNAT family N-acetyltransferase [Christensenella sp.]MEA5002780.1 GNAT family N-acetyltransferase [Christensenella sp.]
MTFSHSKDRIFLEGENHKVLAFVSFPPEGDGVVNAKHTYVDPSLRGQGVGDKLMLALIDELKKNGKKVKPTCPFVVKWFERHSEYASFLAES